MQLNQFNGGLNTRAAPYLVQQTEGVVYDNIDILSGALTPMADDVDMVTAAGKNLYNFNDTWLYSDTTRSYVEFQSALYYTDGVEPRYISETDSGKLGLKAPTNTIAYLLGGAYDDTISYTEAFACNAYGTAKKTAAYRVTVNGFNGVTNYITPATVGLTDTAFGTTFARYMIANDSWLILLANNVTFLGEQVTLASIFYADGSFYKNIRVSSSCTNLLELSLGTNVFAVICDGSPAVDRVVRILDGSTWTTANTWTSCAVNTQDEVAFFNYNTLAMSINGISATAVSGYTYWAAKIRFNNDYAIIGHATGITIYNKDGTLQSNIVHHDYLPTAMVYGSIIALNSTHIFCSVTEPGTGGHSHVRVYTIDGTFVQDLRTTDGGTYISHFSVTDTMFSAIEFKIGVSGGTALYAQLNMYDIFVYVTSYNSSLGIESMPTEPFELKRTKDVIFIVSVAWSIVATNATHSRIYINKYGTPLLGLELAAPTTYVADRPIPMDGSALDSYVNGAPPDTLINLTVYNTMLFGSVGDKLYFSEVAYPHSWGPFSFIDFDADITGIGSTANGLLVFTLYRTYIVIGTSPADMSKYLLNPAQGCVAHKSIGFVNNNLVWVSTDGICASSGGEIQVISKNKLGKLNISNIVGHIILDERYYLALTDKIIVVDFSLGQLIFYTISVQCDGLAVYNDEAYYSKLGKLYKLNAGTGLKAISYKSGQFAEGSLSNAKVYKDIYLYVKYTDGATLKVYIDSVLIGTYTLVTGFNNIKVPQNKQRGYYIEFEISGKCTVNEIEYKVEGRQNGK